jgi:membrane protease YdiL (CAAX protease family)
VAYNNLLFALPGDLAFPPAWAFYPRAVLVPLAVIVWAVRGQGLSLPDLGITSRDLRASALAGLVVAAAVSAAAVLYFVAFPVDYETVADDSAGEFAQWAALEYPLNAALQEEVLFRGVLLALALRSFGVTGAIALTSAAFAGWHVAVDYDTMSDTNVADNDALFALAQAGSLAALFVAGLLFAALRLRWGSLAGPVVFHWLVVVAINATLFVQSR